MSAGTLESSSTPSIRVTQYLPFLLLLSAYFYFLDTKRLDPRGMFKGFVVEFGLSFAIFWGLWFLMDWRRFEEVMQSVGRMLGKPF